MSCVPRLMPTAPATWAPSSPRTPLCSQACERGEASSKTTVQPQAVAETVQVLRG